uniref:Nucleoredoxin n=2 Tax=Cacopsylla melanoneura TaxID=428564 RepID=A0A8D8Q080_9HEMI
MSINSPICTSSPKISNIDQSVELLSSVSKFDLGGRCSRNGQERITFHTLTSSCQVLGLYFSAHWCPPCKAFTPQLIETYWTLKEEGRQFEIIFISSDRSETSYQTYLNCMPWLSIPYNHSTTRSSLATLYNIQGIPSLVLLSCKEKKNSKF